jgi:hypothetical protein
MVVLYTFKPFSKFILKLHSIYTFNLVAIKKKNSVTHIY